MSFFHAIYSFTKKLSVVPVSFVVSYNGPVTELRDYFASIGKPAPSGFNISDHAIFVVQTADVKELDWMVEVPKPPEVSSEQKHVDHRSDQSSFLHFDKNFTNSC